MDLIKTLIKSINMEEYNLHYIQQFYKNQSNQLNKINKIQEWFQYLEKVNNNPSMKLQSNNTQFSNTLLILGNIGIGKSIIGNIFCNELNYDVLDIGKLFDVYEGNKNYTTKDFIPKILKQKNVSNYENIHKKKLLLIDSLEEFIEIQKSVIKEIIDNLENLGMPIVIISEKNSFEDLEKKVLTKLKKSCYIIELEKPNIQTITNYITNIIHFDIKQTEIEKLFHYSKGDMRFLNNMIHFQKILKTFVPNETSIVKNIGDNLKDIEIEVESAIKDINNDTIPEAFNKCETDPFIFGMLTYENYIYNNNKYPDYKRNYIIEQLCFADQIEKNLFKYQQWELLDVYSYFSTIYPWRLLEPPKNINPSTTLQKFLNTKKRNKKYDLPF